MVALALAVLLALPAAAGSHSSVPLPDLPITDLLDRLAGNPLAHCLPDPVEEEDTDVDRRARGHRH